MVSIHYKKEPSIDLLIEEFKDMHVSASIYTQNLPKDIFLVSKITTMKRREEA